MNADPGTASDVVRSLFYPAGRQMDRHCDGRARISLILAGALTEEAGRTLVEAGALCVAVKSADAPHATRFGPEGARIVSIDLEALAEPEWPIPRWCWSTGVRLRDEVQAVIAALVEVRQGPRDPIALDGLGEACLVLLDAMSRTAPVRDARTGWLRAVQRRLDREPDRSPSVADLARAAGVSATHLTRCFKARHGCTVVEYRTRQRVRRALRRLDRSDRTLVDVALDAGFHDQAHFTRQFRSVTGTTPGAWRRYLLAA